MLFGDVNPGGKLPITFPHSVGDLPDFYNHKPSANRSYAFSTREPLYPFGYGLSYTTFKFDNLRVEPQQIYGRRNRQGQRGCYQYGDARRRRSSADVHSSENRVGHAAGDACSKDFSESHLKPGEKKTVEFTITPDTLSMLNVDMHSVVEPGIFEIMVGPGSDAHENRDARGYRSL